MSPYHLTSENRKYGSFSQTRIPCACLHRYHQATKILKSSFFSWCSVICSRSFEPFLNFRIPFFHQKGMKMLNFEGQTCWWTNSRRFNRYKIRYQNVVSWFKVNFGISWFLAPSKTIFDLQSSLSSPSSTIYRSLKHANDLEISISVILIQLQI